MCRCPGWCGPLGEYQAEELVLATTVLEVVNAWSLMFLGEHTAYRLKEKFQARAS